MKRIRRATTRERTQRRSAERRAASDAEELRRCNDAFMFFRVCRNGACRRANTCRGEPHGCSERHWNMFSEGQKVWFRAAIRALLDGQSVQQAKATANAAEASYEEGEARRIAAERAIQMAAEPVPREPPMPRIGVL
jgi:hypothetical protein